MDHRLESKVADFVLRFRGPSPFPPPLPAAAPPESGQDDPRWWKSHFRERYLELKQEIRTRFTQPKQQRLGLGASGRRRFGNVERPLSDSEGLVFFVWGVVSI